MRNTHFFLIESSGHKHDLVFDGQTIVTFSSFEAAEELANLVARNAEPGASLRFELHFKWTLSDFENPRGLDGM